jgi:transcriptional regulator with PAS, ATPase and Fis domain
VDVRTIFATAKNLEAQLKEGVFREDLYYRINIVPIVLPPLRERGDDIIKLVQFFLHRYASSHGKKDIRLSSEAQKVLLEYDYPGNIRELRNIMERSVLLTQDGVIRLGHLPQRVLDQTEKHTITGQQDRTWSLEQGVMEYERKRIVAALEETDNKKQHAADLLGISRKVLWKKMKDLGILA